MREGALGSGEERELTGLLGLVGFPVARGEQGKDFEWCRCVPWSFPAQRSELNRQQSWNDADTVLVDLRYRQDTRR